MLVAVLPSSQSNLSAGTATITRMNAILTALRGYEGATGILPCPADASVMTGAAAYGTAVSGSGATNNCNGLTTPAGGFVDATNNVAIGMVPFRTLGLSSAYAMDGWGRDIDYAVDTNATACWAASSLTGKISVYDNGTYATTVAALISHGPDGHGAYLPYAGSNATGATSRLNAGYTTTGSGAAHTDADQLVNAHITAAFAQSTAAGSGNGTTLASSEAATGTTFIRKAPSLASGAFDDILVYGNPLWNLSTLSANNPYPVMTVYPPNGLYSAGQNWGFTLTFPFAVSVTGTPELSLSALLPGSGNGIGTSNVAYATYQSGSGTTALIFSYTIGAGDTDSNGIAVSAPVVLNGGTISSRDLCFFPPNLSQVLIGTPPPGWFLWWW